MPHLTDHARVASGDGAVTVSRKQFPCTNWLSCIAYSLHNVFGPCQTASHESSRRLSSALFFHYYIVAPHKVALHVLAPALTSYAVKDQYWLSVYVLLSRVRQFDDLLVLRLPDRAALDGGPHRTWSQNQRGWRHYSKELFWMLTATWLPSAYMLYVPALSNLSSKSSIHHADGM